MKRLLFLASLAICGLFTFAGEIIILNPPIVRVGEENLSKTTFSLKSFKMSSSETKSFAYYPVMANVDEVALTVTFTESVGIANVLVYDANNQLVDMITVDTTNSLEAVLSTETWSTGSYRLVVTYGTTTLEGNFNF